MELIRLDLNNCLLPKDIVACIGEFDGVHIGHQKLIEEVLFVSNEKKLPSAIITFDPHPDFILNKNNNFTYITPLDEKIKFVSEKYNLDYFIIINFSKELSQLNYDEFYELFLKNINTIVVGYDFKFGHKGLGNVDNLKMIHKNIIVVDEIKYNNEKIGSKKIIKLLSNGDVLTTNKLLGRLYKLSGIVTKGSQIGNKIGYPTANIEINDNYSLLKKGVYAARVKYDDKYYLGICNYGYNPSFNKIIKPRLEIHIFDFNQDIYGKHLEVEFIEQVRDEKVFPSVDDFLIQLKKDCEYCINKYGGNYENIDCRCNG